MSDQPNHRTVFFRHLPKTAGTSLTTTLANIYGDGQTHRFRDVGEGFADMFGGVLGARGDVLSLVSGHIPLLSVPEGACGTEFTILREPIARLLSLRRFLEQQPDADRARMGLGARVTIADMLASRNSEVYGQVRNGMARFFSSHASFSDPTRAEFWEPPNEGQVVEDCAAVLGRMTVGTTEDMASALGNLQRKLRIPYPLEIGMENFTTERGGEVSIADIQALIEVNAIDLALFQVVMKAMGRRRAASVAMLADEMDRRTLFDPQPGRAYSPAAIAGRQGFELYEPRGKLCWMGDTGRARIHLAPCAEPRVLTLAFYGVVPHYPLSEMSFTLDGARWRHEFESSDGNGRYRLAPIPAHAGTVEIGIAQPYSAPVAAITAGSPDRRRLGTALLGIQCNAT